jgi:hypothetical protein
MQKTISTVSIAASTEIQTVGLIAPVTYAYKIKEIKVVPNRLANITSKVYVNGKPHDSGVVSSGTILIESDILLKRLWRLDVKIHNHETFDIEVDVIVTYEIYDSALSKSRNVIIEDIINIGKNNG